MFDPEESVPFSKIPADVVNCEKHKQLARRVARESIVLLKNEGNLLPLDRSELKCVAVVGPTSYNLDVLHGNYTGFSPMMTTPLEGILAALPVGTQVNWARGCDVSGQGHANLVEVDIAVRDADVVIACVGYTPALEGEEAEVMGEVMEGGGDRVRIDLPGRQLELLKKLHAAGKPIVLVLTGGSAIELSWAAENIPAIMMIWYPGEQAGQALADVLFGDHSPAGRLPVTFYRSLGQVPPFEDYNMKGRTYRFMTEAPLYRFGYGLSYTTFAYSNLRLSRNRVKPDQRIEISVNVANSGQRAADEVVQLYVTDEKASVPVPLRHLEGFQRIHLAPGAMQTVTFTLKPEQLACYDDSGRPFVEPGNFTIAVGGGQPDDPASGAIAVDLTVE
jgi:beta-glucosidase